MLSDRVDADSLLSPPSEGGRFSTLSCGPGRLSSGMLSDCADVDSLLSPLSKGGKFSILSCDPG